MAEPGMTYFPLFINIEHKKFLVYGAGQIAARRISGLLRFGASVVVIAPQINETIWQLHTQYDSRQLQIVQRPYAPGELRQNRVDYVLAATNDAAVNTAIVRECRSQAIPVNHAGDRRQCDFYFPALIEIEQEHMVIGVTSTDGNHKKTAKISAMLRRIFA